MMGFNGISKSNFCLPDCLGIGKLVLRESGKSNIKNVIKQIVILIICSILISTGSIIRLQVIKFENG